MAKKTFLGICEDQHHPIIPVPAADLTGKTVVVTGANVGLGFEAAKHFAAMKPARLIIACRSQEKGEIALQAIREASGFDAQKTVLELWLIDLGNFASVLAFGDRFEKDGGKIDILICNAGVFPAEYRSTADGFEEMVQVNHLSTTLLSILLLPRLMAAATKGSIPRLVIVTSSVHFLTRFGPELESSSNIFETLSQKTEAFNSAERYWISKLLNVFFIRALASRLTASGPVLVNGVNPGYCVSSLTRGMDYNPDGLIPHTTEQGSRQLLWAAVGGQGREDELRGAYLWSGQVLEPSDVVLGEEGKRTEIRVWDDTVKILSKLSPKITENISSLGLEKA